jgi:uncharacterized protein (UPF0548 family)
MSAELASRLASAELTYQYVGGTGGAVPDGYHHLRRSLVIAAGAAVFADAASDLFSWQVHLRGVARTASAATAEPGAVVLLAIGAGPERERLPHLHGHGAGPVRRALLQLPARADAESTTRRAPQLAE